MAKGQSIKKSKDNKEKKSSKVNFKKVLLFLAFILITVFISVNYFFYKNINENRKILFYPFYLSVGDRILNLTISFKKVWFDVGFLKFEGKITGFANRTITIDGGFKGFLEGKGKLFLKLKNGFLFMYAQLDKCLVDFSWILPNNLDFSFEKKFTLSSAIFQYYWIGKLKRVLDFQLKSVLGYFDYSFFYGVNFVKNKLKFNSSLMSKIWKW